MTSDILLDDRHLWAKGINIVWKFEEHPDDEFPFVLSLDIRPTTTRTIPSTMLRVEWLKAAMETGVISDDWKVDDYYFVWRFKTDGARIFFALATSGSVED